MEAGQEQLSKAQKHADACQAKISVLEDKYALFVDVSLHVC